MASRVPYDPVGSDPRSRMRHSRVIRERGADRIAEALVSGQGIVLRFLGFVSAVLGMVDFTKERRLVRVILIWLSTFLVSLFLGLSTTNKLWWNTLGLDEYYTEFESFLTPSYATFYVWIPIAVGVLYFNCIASLGAEGYSTRIRKIFVPYFLALLCSFVWIVTLMFRHHIVSLIFGAFALVFSLVADVEAHYDLENNGEDSTLERFGGGFPGDVRTHSEMSVFRFVANFLAVEGVFSAISTVLMFVFFIQLNTVCIKYDTTGGLSHEDFAIASFVVLNTLTLVLTFARDHVIVGAMSIWIYAGILARNHSRDAGSHVMVVLAGVALLHHSLALAKAFAVNMFGLRVPSPAQSYGTGDAQGRAVRELTADDRAGPSEFYEADPTTLMREIVAGGERSAFATRRTEIP